MTIDLEAARKAAREARERSSGITISPNGITVDVPPEQLCGVLSAALSDVPALVALVEEMAAEMERMRPVLNAAIAWHKWATIEDPDLGIEPLEDALDDACEAFRPMMPRPPGAP